MQERKARRFSNPVPLRRLPLERGKSQDEFWMQQSNSGAINAFRQLTHSHHRGGRKKAFLPGGKLQPLFKNHTAPPRMERYLNSRPGAQRVLPAISSPTHDSSSASQYIASGHLDNVPTQDRNTVRVYLSSNFEDMKAERSILMRKAVPELQEFCSDQGLHFQLVNLHWATVQGCTDIRGSFTNLRKQEINLCQKASLGPAFVALLSDQRGAPRLPPVLAVEDLNTLKAIVVDENLTGEELFDKLYQRDYNASPSHYVFEPEDNVEDIRALHQLIKEAALLALGKDKITRARYQELTMSVLEEEVEIGIFGMKDPRHHCLMYRREWQHIDAAHTDASVHVDVTTKDGEQVRDRHSQNCIQHLEDQVKQHLGPANCRAYYVRWSEEAGHMWAPTREVQAYLKTFCFDFVTDTKNLVMQALNRMGEKAAKRSLQCEFLHHSHLWAQKSAHFQGQEELLFRVEKFLLDPRRNGKPFVMHGSPGCGKTALMAHIAEKIRTWYTADCVVILRFLGTSAESCSIYNVVVGITTQICMAYGLRTPKLDTQMSTLFKALTVFRNTIDTISQNLASSRPLYILLDGIDQLQPLDESLRALWAIQDFPHNIHMIISTATQVGQANLLKALSSFLTDDSGVHQVKPLDEMDAKKVLTSVLESKGRCLTQDQEQTILDAYKANEEALYLTYLINRALEWRSYSTAELKDTLVSSFQNHLEELQVKYGTLTVQSIVSYITISGVGVHEKELLDLLTCTPEVMEEVGQTYVLHPDNIVAFPPLAWARIRRDLVEFLEERNAYGKTVLGWRHVIYERLSADVLGVIYPGIDPSKITGDGTSLTLSLHENISNMYLYDIKENHSNLISEWAVPLESEQDAVYHLSPQPTSVKNVLKLQKLPVHFVVLLPIAGLQRLSRVMFGSLEWISAKLKAVSVQAVLQDLAPVVSLSKHFIEEGVIEDPTYFDDLVLMLEFLQLAQPSIARDPDAIVTEILCRLPAFVKDYPLIGSLVEQAYSRLAKSGSQHLVPLYPCLPSPRGPVRYTLAGPTHVVGFLERKNLAVMFCQSESVDIWKLDTGELLHCFPINREQSWHGVIPMSNEDFIIVAHYSHVKHVMELSVWSTDTGLQVVESTFNSPFESLSLDASDRVLMVSTVMELDKGSIPSQRCLLGINIHTRDVVHNIEVVDLHQEGIAQILFVANQHGTDNGLVTIGAKMSKDLGFWDLKSERLTFSIDLKCFADHVELLPEDGLIVLGSSDSGAVLVLDLEEGELVQRFEKEEYEGMSSLLITSQGRHALISTRWHGVIVLDLDTGDHCKSFGEEIHKENKADGKVSPKAPVPTKVVMDYKEHFVFVGCHNGTICIYCIATGACVKTLEGHSSRINSLCFDNDQRLHSASDDKHVKVWFVQQILDEYLHRFSSDEIGEWDGIQQFESERQAVFEAEAEPAAVYTYPSEHENISTVVLTADSREVITSSLSGPVKLWSMSDGHLVRSFTEGSCHGATRVYLAYQDQLLVAHSKSGTSSKASILQVWWRESGKEVQLDSQPVRVYTSCVLPRGDSIFTVSPSDKTRSGIEIKLFDLFDARPLSSLVCNIYGAMDSTNLHLQGCSTKVAPSPSDEPRLGQDTGGDASHQDDSTYALLNYFPEDDVSYFFTFLITNNRISMERHVPLHMDTRSPQCTGVLPDGEAITGAIDGSLVVWDLAAQTVVANLYDETLRTASKMGKLKYASSTGLPAHDGPVTSLCLCDDRRHLVTGGIDMKVRMWGVNSRSLLSLFVGHNDQILCVDISDDGQLIASGSADQTVAVWRRTSTDMMSNLYTHNNIKSVKLSRDKTRLIAQTASHSPSIIMMNMMNF